jgi:hypothetical protein
VNCESYIEKANMSLEGNSLPKFVENISIAKFLSKDDEETYRDVLCLYAKVIS